mgnify:CR=1 FL=1
MKEKVKDVLDSIALNDGEEQTLQTSENKFEPNILGNYAVCVQVQKSATVIGTSEPSEVVFGEFDLSPKGRIPSVPCLWPESFLSMCFPYQSVFLLQISVKNSSLAIMKPWKRAFRFSSFL